MLIAMLNIAKLLTINAALRMKIYSKAIAIENPIGDCQSNGSLLDEMGKKFSLHFLLNEKVMKMDFTTVEMVIERLQLLNRCRSISIRWQ